MNNLFVSNAVVDLFSTNYITIIKKLIFLQYIFVSDWKFIFHILNSVKTI